MEKAKSTSEVARDIKVNSKDLINFLVKYHLLTKTEEGYEAMSQLVEKGYVTHRKFDNGKKTVYWTDEGHSWLLNLLKSEPILNTFVTFCEKSKAERDKKRKKNSAEYFKKRKEFQAKAQY